MDAKKFDTGSKDVISWLPNEILGDILSLLPIEEAASTSILSKKWRNVFRLVPHLDFDDSVSLQPENGKRERGESFRNFLDQLQCDSPIKKFSLKRHIGDDMEMAYVNSWISDAVEHGVLEVDLSIKTRRLLLLPPQLFRSKTLVKLTLGTVLYEIPSYVSLPSLKTLFVDKVFLEDADFSCVLLAGYPVLEELSVDHKDIATPHTISSPTVKRLSLDYVSDSYDRDCHLSLDLSNLVYLDYTGFALREYPQVNLESLVEAKLDLHPPKEFVGVYHHPTDIKPDLTILIAGLRNVQILHLSPCSVDVISRCVKRGLLLPVFNNLVNLSFGSNNMNKRGWKLLGYLLKQSPNLETLNIQDLNGYTCNDSMPPNKVKVLHILSYRGTAEALKQLKSFCGEFECLEVVQVDVVEEDNVLHTKRDLKMLLGVSLPSKCHFKVT